jgi:hypothetical protein
METDPVQIADVREYVSEMAAQLAELCRPTMPIVAKMLDLAAELARVAQP